MLKKRVIILTGKDKGKHGRIQKQLTTSTFRITTDDGFRIILSEEEFEVLKEDADGTKVKS